jgi:hypothetical protein
MTIRLDWHLALSWFSIQVIFWQSVYLSGQVNHLQSHKLVKNIIKFMRQSSQPLMREEFIDLGFVLAEWKVDSSNHQITEKCLLEYYSETYTVKLGKLSLLPYETKSIRVFKLLLKWLESNSYTNKLRALNELFPLMKHSDFTIEQTVIDFGCC